MDLIRLSDGSEMAIRPLCESDRDRLHAAYSRLSPDSRYRRFLAAKPHLSGGELRYLTQIDGYNHVALIATPAEDPDRIVGVARFVRLEPDIAAAEFAIVVGDEYQGIGAGAVLLRRLADAAIERGIDRFTATMLADNEPAHRLVRGLAGEFVQQQRHGTVDELIVELGARAKAA